MIFQKIQLEKDFDRLVLSIGNGNVLEMEMLLSMNYLKFYSIWEAKLLQAKEEKERIERQNKG